MTYITVAVYPVPTANKDAFKAHSERMAPLFTKHGALSAVDCWGDNVPPGEVTSFPMAVKCNEDETVAYSHIIWPSKAAHDEGMPKAMEDMQSASQSDPMPFDGKRMIFASFEALVEA